MQRNPVGRRVGLFGGIILAILILFSTLWQYSYSFKLSEYILKNGRIVLSSSELNYPPDDPGQSGGRAGIIDGDPSSPVVLRYPAPPPEGVYLLIDTALSHWPPQRDKQTPRARKPAEIIFYNGVCQKCEPEKFRGYSRVRRVRIEILNRKANNPDKDYLHEKTYPVRSFEWEFEDRPGPQRVKLNMPRALDSPAYPQNVFYIVTKIVVLSVYPGEVFNDRVALGELIYGDWPVVIKKSQAEENQTENPGDVGSQDETLQPEPPPFLWK